MTVDDRVQGALDSTTDAARSAPGAGKRLSSEGQYRQLFENMSSGFALHEIIVDDGGKPVDYRFLEVNAAFEGLTGLKREALIGKTLDESFPGLRAKGIPQRYAEVVRTGIPVELDDVYYGDDRVVEGWFRVKVTGTSPRADALAPRDFSTSPTMPGTWL